MRGSPMPPKRKRTISSECTPPQKQASITQFFTRKSSLPGDSSLSACSPSHSTRPKAVNSPEPSNATCGSSISPDQENRPFIDPQPSKDPFVKPAAPIHRLPDIAPQSSTRSSEPQSDRLEPTAVQPDVPTPPDSSSDPPDHPKSPPVSNSTDTRVELVSGSMTTSNLDSNLCSVAFSPPSLVPASESEIHDTAPTKLPSSDISSLTDLDSDSFVTQPYTQTFVSKTISFDLPSVSDDSESEDETDFNSEEAVTCICPFCAMEFDIQWADIVDDIFATILPYFAPLVRRHALSIAKTPASKADWIRKHHLDQALTKETALHASINHPICQEHKKRAALQEAHFKDWPLQDQVDFDSLRDRVEAIIPILDQVIQGDDIFANTFYMERLVEMTRLGRQGFRAQLEKRLQTTRPGYYGPRGADIIGKVLSAVYVHSNEPLTEVELGPFKEDEFVFQILLPTAAALIIQDDLSRKFLADVPWETALNVMRESATYGELVTGRPPPTLSKPRSRRR